MYNNQTHPVKPRIIVWPKKPHRSIPLDALPGGEYAERYAEMARAGHAEDIQRVSKNFRTKIALAIATSVVIVVVSTLVIKDLHDQLEAPDYVLKQTEAQRRIVLGPLESALHEDPKSGDRLMPPRNWNPVE